MRIWCAFLRTLAYCFGSRRVVSPSISAKSLYRLLMMVEVVWAELFHIFWHLIIKINKLSGEKIVICEVVIALCR